MTSILAEERARGAPPRYRPVEVGDGEVVVRIGDRDLDRERKEPIGVGEREGLVRSLKGVGEGERLRGDRRVGDGDLECDLSRRAFFAHSTRSLRPPSI